MKKAYVILLLGIVLLGTAGLWAGGAKEKKAEEVSQPVQLTLWVYANPDGRWNVFQGFIDEWNRLKPETQIKMEQIPFDRYMGEVLAAALVGGRGPDIFLLSRGDYRKYVEGGLVYPMDEFFTPSMRQDFLPQVLEAVTYKGKIMTYPFEMDPVVLFYNKEMFAKAGLQPPKTWDELYETAVKLTTPQTYGIYLAPAPNAYQNFIFSPFVWMAGADFADPEIKESRFKGPGAEKALDLWRRLAQAKATPTTAIVESLANGLAAMEVAGPWKIGSYRRNFKEFYETKMGIAPLPPPTANDKPLTVYGGWGFALNAKSNNIKRSGEFVAWIFSDPNRGVRWTTQGRTCLAPQRSIRETAAHKSFWEDPKHRVFLDVMATARSEAANPEEINKIIQDAIQKAFTGQGTIPEIVTEADRRINEYIRTQRK